MTERKKRIMLPKEALTPELLRVFFDYNPNTGDVTWKAVSAEMQQQLKDTYGFKAVIGNLAGNPAFTSINKTHKYAQGGLGGRVLLKHIVCYAIYHNVYPDQDIDHVNHDRLDCRIDNLRLVTRKQNLQNMGKRKNESKYGPNITKPKNGRAFYIQVVVKGQAIRVNAGRDLEEARKKRDEIVQSFGYHENHGKAINK